ncbi:MAG: threonine/serine dehydratase [Actinomycetota bacterium]|nr:threonine/serine dehydratase [Actinomycetota bacterium]
MTDHISPTRDAIQTAAQRIDPHVRTTPVVEVEGSAFGLTGSLLLKLELLQHTGSFKPRGAFNRVLEAGRPEVVVAASGGNHGLAVAHVARALRARAEIFVPATAPQVKVDGIRALDAQVELVGSTYAHALAASSRRAEQVGALIVHAYDQPEVMAGQGTVGRELEQQCPDLDTVLVAVGGGGLIGGIATWWSRRARVVAVEPVGCPTLHAALEAGGPVDVEVGGLASDALGAGRIGRLGLAAAIAADVRSVLVTADAIGTARLLLWQRLRVAAEPGGATALAALISGAYRPAPGERVAVVVCGGNADPADLAVGVSPRFGPAASPASTQNVSTRTP